jgi:hypothetical protein
MTETKAARRSKPKRPNRGIDLPVAFVIDAFQQMLDASPNTALLPIEPTGAPGIPLARLIAVLQTVLRVAPKAILRTIGQSADGEFQLGLDTQLSAAPTKRDLRAIRGGPDRVTHRCSRSPA